jgi:hypothetical protein
LIAIELILPVTVTAKHPTRDTAAAEIKPAHVLTVLVERYSRGNFEDLSAANAFPLLQVGLGDILGTVTDEMLVFAGNTGANRGAYILIEFEGELFPAAGANGISVVVNRILDALAVVEQFGPDILLGISNSVFATLA